MKMLRTTMPDGSKWDVPVLLIAQNRAKYYAKEFGGDIEKSMDKDTGPLFNDDEYEIKDWAVSNMNWDDVKIQAKMVKEENEPDYQEGWVNGDNEVLDV